MRNLFPRRSSLNRRPSAFSSLVPHNSAVILASAFLASRVLGVVKNTVLYSTTPSAELNAFITAFRVPDLIFVMLSGGALTSALIPTLSAALTRGDEEGAWQTAT